MMGRQSSQMSMVGLDMAELALNAHLFRSIRDAGWADFTEIYHGADKTAVCGRYG